MHIKTKIREKFKENTMSNPIKNLTKKSGYYTYCNVGAGVN